MKWSLQQLHKYNGQPFEIETSYDFSEEIKNIDDILSIHEAKVMGTGINLYQDRFEFILHIECVLVLEDARTLDPVDFIVDLEVVEVFDIDGEEDEDVRIIDKNTIDLRPIVWENILLEKPIRYVKDESSDELE